MTISQDIATTTPAGPQLSLVHITKCKNFRKIIRAGKLVAQLCPVMSLDLIYLFYGRPAYRPGQIGPTTRGEDDRPIFFLFDTDSVSEPHGIYPFDTGAHAGRKYAPHMDGINFPELDCVSISNAEKKIVGRYFGNNEDYYFGKCLPHLDPAPSSPAAAAFHNLITASGIREHDDRCLTIEVSTKNDVLIDRNLKVAFLPDFLLGDPEIKNWIELQEKNGTKIKSYRNFTISNSARTVEQNLIDICEAQGII